ncbi:hypothetical protein BDF21DRAFT_404598 [Thamnidium elegans]|nr:hypothetical protein BDF21DRAFT_404598 [Thamnidium elegans]
MDFEIEDDHYNLNKLTDFEKYLKNKPLDVEMSGKKSRETDSKSLTTAFEGLDIKKSRVHEFMKDEFNLFLKVATLYPGPRYSKLSSNLTPFCFQKLYDPAVIIKIIKLRLFTLYSAISYTNSKSVRFESGHCTCSEVWKKFVDFPSISNYPNDDNIIFGGYGSIISLFFWEKCLYLVKRKALKTGINVCVT